MLNLNTPLNTVSKCELGSLSSRFIINRHFNKDLCKPNCLISIVYCQRFIKSRRRIQEYYFHIDSQKVLSLGIVKFCEAPLAALVKTRQIIINCIIISSKVGRRRRICQNGLFYNYIQAFYPSFRIHQNTKSPGGENYINYIFYCY